MMAYTLELGGLRWTVERKREHYQQCMARRGWFPDGELPPRTQWDKSVQAEGEGSPNTDWEPSRTWHRVARWVDNRAVPFPEAQGDCAIETMEAARKPETTVWVVAIVFAILGLGLMIGGRTAPAAEQSAEGPTGDAPQDPEPDAT